ncbi:MAG: YdcF family protein [Thermoflexales bacterium]|nr:YdcF family protein [Thermoflexales bacterium]MCS7324324.1 YdcF family protein [Thermoflexales bacterium]MDW8053312.1 ElyC/SanA/YdcF family protein [Anaerolineae bacterium]MDW8291963.1 ElyC/SanA/YdcF family protein [Anaerolineae bacterium]
MRRMLGALLVVASLALAPRLLTALWAQGRVFSARDHVPPRSVAIVFGAGARNGYPSAVLYDRVSAAAELYHDGRVGALLLSGDGRFPTNDEPEAMRRLALRLGVPASALQVDPLGLNTRETCRRAREHFGVNDAVLVTQAFHLDRALFTCAALGIDAVGYVADRRVYRAMPWYQLREVAATWNLWWHLLRGWTRAAFAAHEESSRHAAANASRSSANK